MKTSLVLTDDFFMRVRILHQKLSISALFALFVFACPLIAASDDAIHGSVQNLSQNQSAIGDEVLLIRINVHIDPRLNQMLDPATQEETEAHTKTDTEGVFAFHVRYPEKPYLVRVVHQGIAYDQRAFAGDNLSIQVFNATANASPIAGSIEILRIGSRAAGNEKFLHVSDMYEVRNNSNPPVTQAGAHTFDVFLPADARIDSVLAAAPTAAESAGRGAGQSTIQGTAQGPAQGRIGVMISAAPVPGEPGHYAVNFPLRPGATKFAFNYDVPYSGHTVFRTRHEYGFQQMAVMIPPTMKFSSQSSTFQKLATSSSEYQVEAAIRLKEGEGPAFEISGSGPLPPLQTNSQESQSATITNSAVFNPTVPHPSSVPNSKSEDTSVSGAKLAVIGGLLFVCALLVWHTRNILQMRSTRADSSQESSLFRHSTNASTGFLKDLKEELFQLETDRIRGFISADEYASARQALEENFKRLASRKLDQEKAPEMASLLSESSASSRIAG